MLLVYRLRFVQKDCAKSCVKREGSERARRERENGGRILVIAGLFITKRQVSYAFLRAIKNFRKGTPSRGQGPPATSSARSCRQQA
jgi:hypothetical protein